MFKEMPANKKSLAIRNKTHGVGINDARYLTQYKGLYGNTLICPFYKVWKSMIGRCYSKKIKEKHPTYVDCITSKEWLIFSNFKLWMISQDWEGKFLDKDLLVHGNKEYSQEKCIFVSRSVNNLFINVNAISSNTEHGACYVKTKDIYISNISIDGKKKHLGEFKLKKDALSAYNYAKAENIKRVASLNKHNTTLYNALMYRAGLIIKGEF